jgi:hypothetical protein
MLEVQLPPVDLRDVRQHVRGISSVLVYERGEVAQQFTLTDMLKRGRFHHPIQRSTHHAIVGSRDFTELAATKWRSYAPSPAPAGPRQLETPARVRAHRVPRAI